MPAGRPPYLRLHPLPSVSAGLSHTFATKVQPFHSSILGPIIHSIVLMSTELRHYSWTESEKLRGYRCHTRAMVAAISEAHICKLALDQTPYFVRAFEGGRADGGILVEGSGLQGSTADRLLALGLLGKVVSSSGGPMIERTGGVVEGKKRKDRVKCFAVEVKHISPRFDGKRFLCWPIHFRKPQWDTCVAVILTSSREADYVALLPLGCIRAAGADVKLANNGALCVYGRGFQPQWMLQALPAFPPELAPFMLPSSRLRVVFDSLRSSAGGKVGAWYAVQVPFKEGDKC